MKKYDIVKSIVMARTKVLFLKGEPGIGKSAIAKKIAKEENLLFIDIRLAQIDSTEILGLPRVKEINGIEVMSYAIPEWAYFANSAKEKGYKGSLILFDEYNRAQIEVRNACMQILLDHSIGYNFKFNDDVYLMAAGNLGEEDGTEVEEIESAQKDRMATMKYEALIDDWIEEYANDNVNSFIISFLKNYPDYLCRRAEKDENFATPRSWSFLSDHIGKNEKDTNKIIKTCLYVGEYYIGSSFTRFLRYLEEVIAISIKDVLERFDQVKNVLKTLDRSRTDELIKNLEEYKFDLIKKDELENVIKFLKIIDDDERIGYFKHIVKKYAKKVEGRTERHKNVDILVNVFTEDFKIINNIK